MAAARALGGTTGTARRSAAGPDASSERTDQAALLFVEEIALLLEREGLPRMAGRVLGWLLVCDPPEQSAADLAGVLEASRGSISTMTTLLERAQMIERVARRGDRRDYYRVRPGSWSALLADGLRRIQAMRQVMERGLAALAGRPSEARARIEDAYDVLAFFEREYPTLLHRWEAARRR